MVSPMEGLRVPLAVQFAKFLEQAGGDGSAPLHPPKRRLPASSVYRPTQGLASEKSGWRWASDKFCPRLASEEVAASSVNGDSSKGGGSSDGGQQQQWCQHKP